MPDVFDRIQKKSQGDIFDRLTKKAKPDIFDKVVEKSNQNSKKGFLQKFGELMQSQEETPLTEISKESALGAIKQATGGTLEGLTLGAVSLFKPEDENEQLARSYFEFMGLTGPIGVAQKGLGSVYGLIKSGALKALAQLGGAGALGAGVKTAQNVFKEGELPTPKEVVKHGAEWMAIDAILQTLGLGASFGQAVRNIAKKENIPVTKVFGNLWNASKNFVKGKFGRNIKTAQDIKPEDVEILAGKAQKAQEKGLEHAQIEYTEPKKIEFKSPEQKVSTTVPEEKFPENEPIFSPSGKQLTYPEIKIESPKQPKTISTAETKLSSSGSEGEKSKVQVPLRYREKPVQAKGSKETPPETKPRRSVMGKEQAAKRSDIIKLFRKAFNDPIRLGKIRQGKGGLTRGEHKLWSRVTRLLRDNDIEAAAHEIGHNLHTTLYGGDAKTSTEQRANIIKALKPYLNELKNLAHYEPYTLEGFAEFTRLYVTNPEVARKLAPKFYQKFETDLDAQYPDLKNALLEARDYYESYLQGTPESRIDAQTDYGKDSSFLNNLIDWIKDPINLDKLKTNFLDDVFPAKRLVAEAFGIPLTEVENLKDPRNLYRSLRVLKGAIGKADVFVLHETFDPLTFEKKGLGLRQILQQLPNEKAYKEFNRYLLARRVIEKSEQKILTGINYADALEVVKKLEPQYKELAHELDKYNDALLHYVRKSGLISQEQYTQIKQKNLLYVPFQRVMETEKGGRVATQGELQAGKPIKRMKGSTRDIIAPIESIVKNTYSLIMNAEKNMAGKVLAKLSEMKGIGKYVEHVPIPIHLKAKLSKEEVLEQMSKLFKQSGWMFDKDVMSSAELRIFENVIKPLAEAMPDFFIRFGPGQYKKGETIITVYSNGKPSYYEVSPEIYEMWTKGIAPYTASLITKIARFPARTLRAGAILNPKFMMKNVIRDTWGGFLFTKYGKDIKNPVEFFMDLLYSPLAMLGQAAKQGPLYVAWLKAGGGMSTMQSLDRESVFKKLQEIRNGYSPLQVIKWLRKFAEISEESNRLAEFGRALEVEGKSRLGMEIAAFAARDLSIDFAKIGLQTKAWNQVITFFNATVQGTDKLFRTVASKEDRAEFIMRGIAFIAIFSLILAWLNKDDERIEELQEQEKDFNFVGFVGGTLLKIPVPFETGVLLNGLVRRMFNYFIKHNPDAFKGFMGSIKDAMLPNFIPSIVNPVVEAEANKNFFTGGRIIPEAKKELISKYQYTNYTSLTARLIGRILSYMGGEDIRTKYAAPAVIDHFINSWTGGLGRLAVSITDAGLEAVGLGDKVVKPARPILERLQLDAFVARYPRSNTKSIEEFYDNYQDAMARKKSINYARKMDIETEKGLEAAYRRIDKIYDYPTLERGYQAIQNCQKAINNIYNDPTIDADTKKKMIDDLYLQQIAFAKAANQDIKKYRLSK